MNLLDINFDNSDNIYVKKINNKLLTLCAKPNKKMSGIFWNINDLPKECELEFDVKVITGDCIIIYCDGFNISELLGNNILIYNKNYNFKNDINKIKINTLNKKTRIGIVFLNDNIDYKILVNKMCINYKKCEINKDHVYLPICVDNSKNNIKSITKDAISLTNLKNSKKILLLSTQYPSFGGAATMTYEIHKKLLLLGYDTSCIFFDNTKNINYNPDNLPNVYLEKLSKNIEKIDLQEYYKKIYDYTETPNIIIGFNYVAPLIGKKLFPNINVFYYITGSPLITSNNITCEEYLNTNHIKYKYNEIENICIKEVDYIIPNSFISKVILEKQYKEYIPKMISPMMLELINLQQSKKTNKIYDIVVISSKFDRTVKGIDLINKIYNSQDLNKYVKICIGRNSVENIENANKHFGLVSEKQVLDILSQTKILLICSKYESFSLSMINGLNNNTICLSNKNVGGNFLLDDYYILKDYDEKNWCNKINNILTNYDYHKSIFKHVDIKFNFEEKINCLFNKKFNKTINILFVSVDRPYDGGCSTNTYNMIKSFMGDINITPIGLFISEETTDLDPDNLGTYNIKYDKNIQNEIKKMLNKIENEKGKINLFFVKNYKAFICISKIININSIIYSPSGLRFVSNLNKEFKNIVEDDFKCTNDIDYNTNLNVFDFIKKYDLVIENYIFNNCKYILPNSKLTHDLIKKTYKNTILLDPIDITYIDFKKKDIDNFHNRKYDIAFICFSWKRKVKNYDLVKKIISNQKFEKYKILIIGKDQKKK